MTNEKASSRRIRGEAFFHAERVDVPLHDLFEVNAGRLQNWPAIAIRNIVLEFHIRKSRRSSREGWSLRGLFPCLPSSYHKYMINLYKTSLVDSFAQGWFCVVAHELQHVESGVKYVE